MTWTYSNPSASQKDEVRFLVGDTDTSEQLLTNEEIQYLLTTHVNVYLAAAYAAEAIASKFAKFTDETAKSVSVSYSQKYEHYKELAKQLMAKAKPIGGAFVGGIDCQDVQARSNDMNTPEKAFRLNRFP